MAFCFHPGPYTVDLTPFALAPEWGLRLRFVVDAANPRVAQQRFDLYLYSETAGRLELAAFAVAAEMALQAELAQGALDLPPCISVEEWHAFRAGLNQLIYTRYGLTVEDCVPVDLGEQIDYATVLQARAQQAAATSAYTQPVAVAVSANAGAVPGEGKRKGESKVENKDKHNVEHRGNVEGEHDAMAAAAVAAPADGGATVARTSIVEQDARALRRLFLELPALSSALRLLTLPEGMEIFQQHQSLLLRLGMAALNVNTMPSLAWATPDQPLPWADQASRSAQTLIAQAALDEAWALLARLQLASPDQWPSLLDEADRICANLETGLSLRRTTYIPRLEPSL